MMSRDKQPRLALVWSQFAACHVDRCIALAQRLEGRAEVLAIEVASTSKEYADFPQAGDTGGATKRTLFPGQSFEAIPRWRRFLAVLWAVAGCRIVFIGVPYSNLEFVLLAWVLRLLGKQTVLMCDSKFDDFPRGTAFESAKALGLSCFSAVMVAGSRGAEYFRFLGFRRRPVLFGYDTVGVARIQEEGGLGAAGSTVPFAKRDFVYVGRFIEKKNFTLLIEGFAHYCQMAGSSARRLVLVGSGPLEERLREEAATKAPDGSVIFAGFLSGAQLHELVAKAIGLLLVSRSEQWGLVVNEAVALGVPLIVSEAPGSRDLLVRNLVNGYVVENGSCEGLARAMLALGEDEDRWQAMRQASLERAWMGDVECFADAVELLLDPAAQPAGTRMDAYIAELEDFRGNPNPPSS